MPRFERAELLKKFRAMAARGEPTVGGGAGTGLSAKCDHTRKCHGFYGASSMERLPVERALTEQVRKFKAIGGR
jgi:predicted TIM-barrel enzyme